MHLSPRAARGWHCRPPAGPVAALTDPASAGLAPGLGSGPPLLPPPPPRPPPPRAQAVSSRGHGVALGPPLRVSASAALVPGSRGPRSSGSAQAGAALRTPSPGSGGRRARRAAAAAAAEAGGGGGAAQAAGLVRRPLLLGPGRPARAGRPRRRRAPGAGAARRALRASRRRAPAGARRRAAPPSSILGRQEAPCPGAGDSPGRPAQPSSRPRRPATGTDMGARGCAPGRGTRKVC